MDLGTILTTGFVGILTSIITAYLTSQFKIKQERVVWERELTQKIAELKSTDIYQANRLIRSYAIGFLILDHPNQEHREKIFVPPIGRLSVGRSSNNDIVLSDTGCSKHHAVFEIVDKRVRIRELGATNGTKVNGRRLRQPVLLQDGDVILIEDTSLTYRTFE